MMRSPCCNAEVRVTREWLSLMGGEMWADCHTCDACGQPCDPVDHVADARKMVEDEAAKQSKEVGR